MIFLIQHAHVSYLSACIIGSIIGMFPWIAPEVSSKHVRHQQRALFLQ